MTHSLWHQSERLTTSTPDFPSFPTPLPCENDFLGCGQERQSERKRDCVCVSCERSISISIKTLLSPHSHIRVSYTLSTCTLLTSSNTYLKEMRATECDDC